MQFRCTAAAAARGPVHGLIDRWSEEPPVRCGRPAPAGRSATLRRGRTGLVLVDRLVGAGVRAAPEDGRRSAAAAARPLRPASTARRQQVGGGRAGGADHRGRSSGGARRVQCLVAGGALVDADRHFQFGRSGGRRRQRARSGAPGQTHAARQPQRTSSSMISSPHRRFRMGAVSGKSAAGCEVAADLGFQLRPLRIRGGAGHTARCRV